MKLKENNRNQVFIISLLVTGGIAAFAIVNNEIFTEVSNSVFTFLTVHFAWLYLLVMLIFVLFVIGIACSSYGNLKLGSDDSRPEYSTLSWFAMLFCAGMGVGLVFWGISEPVSHFISPSGGIEKGTSEAAVFAFKSVFMHWGLHPWANYAILGLALAYFQFRKDKHGLVSSTLEPLIGEKHVRGWFGNIVDILAVFATVAGVVTSLGLGVLQISSGLEFMFGFPDTLFTQIIIICVITVVYMWSATSGINKGVKCLSDLNLFLALSFMIMAVLFGPKLEIVNNFVSGLGGYLGSFLADSLAVTGYGDNSWIEGWRVFYWAWWIAWAPFVGVFIARISKGRTIREFVIGVVLAPTFASFIWFAIFGTLGIHLGMKGEVSSEMLQQIALMPESGLFIVLQQYPLSTFMSIIAVLLLGMFFITSADSGTYVLSMLSSDGKIDPPNSKKVIWGIIQTCLAIGLLVSGGLKPLQTISIAAAFPFMFIMIAVCISFVKALRKER